MSSTDEPASVPTHEVPTHEVPTHEVSTHEVPAAAAPVQAEHVEVHVIDTRDDYLAAVAAIAAGEGPIAIDAERASGYRYSQRAYLIQIFRRGSGTYLFDPPATPKRTCS